MLWTAHAQIVVRRGARPNSPSWKPALRPPALAIFCRSFGEFRIVSYSRSRAEQVVDFAQRMLLFAFPLKLPARVCYQLLHISSVSLSISNSWRMDHGWMDSYMDFHAFFNLWIVERYKFNFLKAGSLSLSYCMTNIMIFAKYYCDFTNGSM